MKTTPEPEKPERPPKTRSLRWTGDLMPDGFTPQRFFTGVPARDLAAADLETLPEGFTVADLLASGLYTESET